MKQTTIRLVFRSFYYTLWPEYHAYPNCGVWIVRWLWFSVELWKHGAHE